MPTAHWAYRWICHSLWCMAGEMPDLWWPSQRQSNATSPWPALISQSAEDRRLWWAEGRQWRMAGRPLAGHQWRPEWLVTCQDGNGIPTKGHPSGKWTTRGYANSQTGHLADWTSCGLDNSRTSQLADSRMPPKERKLSTQGRRWHLRVVQTATCPVRELSSPQDVQSASRPVRELAIRELSSNHPSQY